MEKLLEDLTIFHFENELICCLVGVCDTSKQLELILFISACYLPACAIHDTGI